MPKYDDTDLLPTLALWLAVAFGAFMAVLWVLGKIF